MAFSTHDIVPDSPTNNFATLSPLLLRGGTLSDGNLKLSGGGNYTGSFSTILIQRTGKWYVEVRTNDTTDDHAIVIFPTSNYAASAQATANGLYISSYGASIDIYTNNGSTTLGNVSETATTTGDVLGYLIDVENGRVTITKNGVHKLTVTNWTALDEEHFIGYNVNTTWPACNKTFNFGQDATFGSLESPSASNTDQNGHGEFLYAPVDSSNNAITDFKALCTANLPEMTPDVTGDVPQDYFKAVNWTGNETGNSNDAVKNIEVGFKGDLIWMKARNLGGNSDTSWHLFDSVRGGKNRLDTSGTSAEGVTGAANNWGGFTSTGFDVIYSTPGYFNWTSQNSVAYVWKAGGSPSATDDGTGVSGSAKLVDTSGAASSTTCKSFKDAAVTAGASNVICPSKMSINQAAGFSIVKYSGNATDDATVPHGLSQTPDLWIAKCTSHGKTWMVYHKSLSSGYVLMLSDVDVERNGFWGGQPAAPDQNVLRFTKGSGLNSTPYYDNVNHSGQDYIAYCWHSVEGYSNFGSYTGNESTDGTFVYCGFRVGWLMVKTVDYSTSTTSWQIWDNARSEYNPANKVLYANRSAGEGYRGDGSTSYSTMDVDLLSNGFKFRNYPNENNKGSVKYIYMAFAEQPFKYANAR